MEHFQNTGGPSFSFSTVISSSSDLLTEKKVSSGIFINVGGIGLWPTQRSMRLLITADTIRTKLSSSLRVDILSI